MLNNQKNGIPNDASEQIFLTDYFDGGEKKRNEVLAQPEVWCNCPECGTCGCGAECTNCSACEMGCDTMCGANMNDLYASNHSGTGTVSATASVLTNQTMVTGATAVNSVADYNSNNSQGWSNFWPWG